MGSERLSTQHHRWHHNRELTTCAKGHALRGANVTVYVASDGYTRRRCLACHRERAGRWLDKENARLDRG